jgi:hypothetical protein
VIDYYRTRNLLHTVPGDQAVGDVTRQISEILKTVSQFSQNSDCQASAQALCIVTKAIQYSELYRLLNNILSFDSQAQLSWLRVLQDVA